MLTTIADEYYRSNYYVDIKNKLSYILNSWIKPIKDNTDLGSQALDIILEYIYVRKTYYKEQLKDTKHLSSRKLLVRAITIKDEQMLNIIFNFLYSAPPNKLNEVFSYQSGTGRYTIMHRAIDEAENETIVKYLIDKFITNNLNSSDDQVYSDLQNILNIENDVRQSTMHMAFEQDSYIRSTSSSGVYDYLLQYSNMLFLVTKEMSKLLTRTPDFIEDQIKAAEFLINRGVDLSIKNNGNTIFHKAIIYKMHDMATLISKYISDEYNLLEYNDKGKNALDLLTINIFKKHFTKLKAENLLLRLLSTILSEMIKSYPESKISNSQKENPHCIIIEVLKIFKDVSTEAEFISAIHATEQYYQVNIELPDNLKIKATKRKKKDNGGEFNDITKTTKKRKLTDGSSSGKVQAG
ncbi:hypothetical protein ACRRVD_02795 [Candidatus Cardinium hertigii]|uniref:hypothetical protein n=1 Tax=Candidatus Cardinium hertigii TaxID=247481 RepID=UPI003D7EED22